MMSKLILVFVDSMFSLRLFAVFVMVFAGQNCFADILVPNKWHLISPPDGRPVSVSALRADQLSEELYGSTWIVYLFENGEYRAASYDESVMPWNGAWFIHTYGSPIEVSALSSAETRSTVEIGVRIVANGWNLIGIPAGKSSVAFSGLRISYDRPAELGTTCAEKCFIHSVVTDTTQAVGGFATFGYITEENRYKSVEEQGLVSSSTGLWLYAPMLDYEISLTYETQLETILEDVSDANSNVTPDYIEEFIAGLDISESDIDRLNIYVESLIAVLQSKPGEAIVSLKQYNQKLACVSADYLSDLRIAANIAYTFILRTTSQQLLLSDIYTRANQQRIEDTSADSSC